MKWLAGSEAHHALERAGERGVGGVESHGVQPRERARVPQGEGWGGGRCKVWGGR